MCAKCTRLAQITLNYLNLLFGLLVLLAAAGGVLEALQPRERLAPQASQLRGAGVDLGDDLYIYIYIYINIHIHV